MNKIESFEIISVNPQVVKINEQIFYGFYLLEKDDKIINIILLRDNLFGENNNVVSFDGGGNYNMHNTFSKVHTVIPENFECKNFVLCITSLNKCIRLFQDLRWFRRDDFARDNHGNALTNIFSLSKINFIENDLSLSFEIFHSNGSQSNYGRNETIKYEIKYNIKQHKYIISPETFYDGYQKRNTRIPLATNFTEMVSVNYNKDDDIISSYEKIKKENENIMNHLNSIVEFNKIKNDEIESLKIINKKHFESNFIDLNKEIEHLRKENSNIIEIKKENDIMKQTISLQEIKISSCQNTIYDLEKYIKQLENKLEEMNHCCFRCNDKYIKSDKKINCEHKYICNHCTLNICMCPKCNTMYG
jgi:hypothetical protein